jgi:hypothetical protein
VLRQTRPEQLIEGLSEVDTGILGRRKKVAPRVTAREWVILGAFFILEHV